MSIKRLLVIVGPTGSGKTDLSIRLARRFGAPILSTDSRQFYRGMPIGTAQPSAEQLQAAEHHFIASHDITESLNCGEYETLALARLGELFATHDWVVAVGGSGLYVQALCDGMDDLPTADEALRAELMRRLREEGLERLAGELRELDPVYWETVDRRNPARVVRALEVCLQSGRPYSELRRGVRRERPFRIVKVGVDLPRGTLYERIDRRVERMLADGLVDEARALYPFRELNALQTVGYRELFDWFDGRTSYEEAVERIKRNTRRYAKRQLTWFRRDPAVRWFAPDADEEIVAWIGRDGMPSEEYTPLCGRHAVPAEKICAAGVPYVRNSGRVVVYSERESNPHGHCWPQDFKSGVSTCSTIRALAFRRKTSAKVRNNLRSAKIPGALSRPSGGGRGTDRTLFPRRVPAAFPVRQDTPRGCQWPKREVSTSLCLRSL